MDRTKPETETIFALASGPGPSGVAVVRVSGPGAGQALSILIDGELPSPRVASLRDLRRPDTGEILDRGLVVWFPGPASFTGENVAELHVHGGRAVVAGLLTALSHMPDLRLAEPGEFTKRAFLNGKLDLSAAEGIADLVDADTEAQRRQALRQMGGALGAQVDSWRDQLIAAAAYQEASIDFADEDLPGDPSEAVRPAIRSLIGELKEALADGRRSERLREGIAVAIVGAPNVGKSSLLNRLVQREAAIVSTVAGTTRDVIEVHLDLGGYPVILADTAGLRRVNDPVEQEGIRRAEARAATADLTLAVFNAEAAPAWDSATLALVGPDTIPVLNKIDLAGVPRDGVMIEGRPVVPVSARTGEGFAALLTQLEQAVAARYQPSEAAALTRLRHREAVASSLAHLERAVEAVLPELVAEDLRLAARELGRITGRVDVEDLLDVIFRDFCIGK